MYETNPVPPLGINKGLPKNKLPVIPTPPITLKAPVVVFVEAKPLPTCVNPPNSFKVIV